MEAIAFVMTNSQEIEYAKQMALKEIPAPNLVEESMVFSVHNVAWAFRTDEGRKIQTMIAGQLFMLKNTPEVWSRLKEHFKHL